MTLPEVGDCRSRANMGDLVETFPQRRIIMRHLALILTLVFLGGLLITNQALAFGQYQPGETLQVAALTGEELRQWHRAQMHTQDNQVQVQHLTAEQIRTLHALLRGYYGGEYESGSIGRETTAAIENFQRDYKLTVTGEPNEETLRALMLHTMMDEYYGIAPIFGIDDEVNTPVFGNDDAVIGPVFCGDDE